MATTRTSVVQQAIKEIETRISGGEWQVGERLPSQHELARLLNLSRTSLRETLSHLESRGMLSIQPGKGVYICEPQPVERVWTRDDYTLAEVLAIRRQLEGFAAANAAQNATEQDIQILERSIELSFQAAKEGDLLRVKLCDLEFHAHIIRVADNRLLHEIIKLIRKPYEQSKMPPHGNFKDMEPTLEEHRQIFLAIKMNEPHLARTAMEQHIKNTALRANINLGESY